MNKVGETFLTGLLSEFWDKNKKTSKLHSYFTQLPSKMTTPGHSPIFVTFILQIACKQATSFEITFESIKK